MIPKLIHQTYKNENLPQIYKECQQEVKRLNPDYEYRFHTDDDIDKFVKEDFPEYYSSFKKLPRHIMRIDMVRYFWMYKYGGIYLDMDYMPFKPFDDILQHRVVIPCNKENESGKPICLGNCIFASEAGHPFWKTLIDTLLTGDRSNVSDDKEVADGKNGTGPGFVFHMWKRYRSKKDIHIPEKSLFHPSTKKENIPVLRKEGKCYGMHYCTGVWRKT